MKGFDVGDIPLPAVVALVAISLFIWSRKARAREAEITKKSGNKKFARNWA
jgi:hypothetical protein